ncbi:hypothetical protein O5D80_005850 [Batrachochytrium dendrobatidis]|nr:hypothetical protein O5D80_005850 [Batrachochytrium dendrobatidis]
MELLLAATEQQIPNMGLSFQKKRNSVQYLQPLLLPDSPDSSALHSNQQMIWTVPQQQIHSYAETNMHLSPASCNINNRISPIYNDHSASFATPQSLDSSQFNTSTKHVDVDASQTLMSKSRPISRAVHSISQLPCNVLFHSRTQTEQCKPFTQLLPSIATLFKDIPVTPPDVALRRPSIERLPLPISMQLPLAQISEFPPPKQHFQHKQISQHQHQKVTQSLSCSLALHVATNRSRESFMWKSPTMLVAAPQHMDKNGSTQQQFQLRPILSSSTTKTTQSTPTSAATHIEAPALSRQQEQSVQADRCSLRRQQPLLEARRRCSLQAQAIRTTKEHSSSCHPYAVGRLPQVPMYARSAPDHIQEKHMYQHSLKVNKRTNFPKSSKHGRPRKTLPISFQLLSSASPIAVSNPFIKSMETMHDVSSKFNPIYATETQSAKYQQHFNKTYRHGYEHSEMAKTAVAYNNVSNIPSNQRLKPVYHYSYDQGSQQKLTFQQNRQQIVGEKDILNSDKRERQIFMGQTPSIAQSQYQKLQLQHQQDQYKQQLFLRHEQPVQMQYDCESVNYKQGTMSSLSSSFTAADDSVNKTIHFNAQQQRIQMH